MSSSSQSAVSGVRESGGGSGAIGREVSHDWSKTVLAELRSHYNNPDTSDVTLVLGHRTIYAHSLILTINSALLGNLARNGPVDLCDYVDHEDTVSEIIQSFYTGSITIQSDNIKVIYKFAKVYAVTWLIQHTLAFFRRMIDSFNFADVITFAHDIACDDLIEACLIKLTAGQHILTALVESGEWVRLPFNAVRTIISSDHLNLEEIEVYKMLIKWLQEGQEESRMFFALQLFNCLRLDLISTTDLLSTVTDWVVDCQATEMDRLAMLKEINSHAKSAMQASTHEPALASSASSSASCAASSSPHILQRVVEHVLSNTQGPVVDRTELLSAVSHHYTRASVQTKQCVVEYMADKAIVGPDSITSLLELYCNTKDDNIGYLCLKYLNTDLANTIHCVKWGDVPFYAARYILSYKSHIPRLEYSVVEAVMKWCDASSGNHGDAGNHGDNNSTDDLTAMLDCICWDSLHPSYLNNVLLPYIRTKFPLYTESPHCTKHSAHPATKKQDVLDSPVVPELYLLQNFRTCWKGVEIVLNKSNKNSPLSLTLRGSHKKRGAYLLLYDDKMTHFPSSSLSLTQLRQMVETYKNLTFILVL